MRWRGQRHQLLALGQRAALLGCAPTPRSGLHAGQLRSLASGLAPRAAATETALQEQQQQQGERQQGEPEPLQTVLLDVGGMKCGGCSAAVKRMLGQRSEVASAAVNLLTETAAVQLRLPAASQAEDLATMLTSKGFPSKVRQAEQEAVDSSELERRRAEEARASLVNLGVAWALVLACCTHHAGHLLHSVGLHGLAHSPLLELLSNPLVSAHHGAGRWGRRAWTQPPGEGAAGQGLLCAGLVGARLPHSCGADPAAARRPRRRSAACWAPLRCWAPGARCCWTASSRCSRATPT
jgi:copper chaperone CopZ